VLSDYSIGDLNYLQRENISEKNNGNWVYYHLQQPTKVLLQAGLDVETIGCSSLSAAVPVDGILLGFCRFTCTFVFQSASVPGLTSNECPASSNTRT